MTDTYHVSCDGTLVARADGKKLADEGHVHWERLVDAGLIANTCTMTPEVRAQAEANDALFRRLARDRRGAGQVW